MTLTLEEYQEYMHGRFICLEEKSLLDNSIGIAAGCNLRAKEETKAQGIWLDISPIFLATDSPYGFNHLVYVSLTNIAFIADAEDYFEKIQLVKAGIRTAEGEPVRFLYPQVRNQSYRSRISAEQPAREYFDKEKRVWLPLQTDVIR